MRTVNLKPFHAEIKRYEGGFSWSFLHETSTGQRVRYVLKFDRWWFAYLSEDLRSALLEEVRDLDRLVSLCGFSDPELDK